MSFFWWLWDGLRSLVGLVLPLFASVGDFRATAPWVRRTLHVAVLLIILVLLLVLQQFLPGLRKQIPYPILNEVWLPAMFVLLYALMWLGRWLWLVWTSDEEGSEFPDIDEAWDEAMDALRAAEIDPQSVPLYLVLGRPAEGEETLFQAAGLPFLVKHAPTRADAPLHVYANRQDGVFVTCAGASRLGPTGMLLALTSRTLAEEPADEASEASEDDTGNATIGAGNQKMKHIRRVAQVLEAAQRKGRAPSQMTAEEQRTLLLLDRADKPEEAARQTERLKHLCRLIVRERRPECPVNGMLVLVPCLALRNDEDAERAATDCRHDLNAAWSVFRLHAPILALVCDLETVPGFAEFLEGYLAHCKTDGERSKERKRRLGKRFGWGLDLDAKTRQAVLAEEVRWIGQGMFPIQIYQNLLRLEKPEREEVAEVVRRNSRLYRFMGTMREGQKRLSRILLHGMESKPDGPALLGGCYLAATGRDPINQQAFVAGVFQRLLEAQAFVSWTDEALADDAAYHRWTRFGYLGLPVFVALVGALFYWWKWRS